MDRLGRGRGARGWLAAAALCGVLLPTMALAQQLQVIFPPTLLVPNYNRVFAGLSESIEAGAAMVTVGTPPALWYNPAGLVKATRTELNASVQGYQLTILNGTGFLSGGAQESNIRTMPSFVGVVLGEEAIHIKNLRFGIGMTNNVSWQQSVNDAAPRPSGASILYGMSSEFQQYTGAVAMAWAVNDTFRLGFSLAVPYTYLSNNGQLNGAISQADSLASSIRTSFFSGYSFHLLPSASFQWDALPWLSLGGMVSPPALRVLSSGNLTLQALSTANSPTTSLTEQLSFRDTSATFDYRIPAEISGGFALRFDPVKFEVDVHWYVANGPYTVVSSTTPVTVINAIQGSAPVASQTPFPDQVWGTRNVVDLNIGGSVRLSHLVTIFAGFYSDHAPGSMSSNLFLPVTFYGGRSGVAFQTPNLSGSVGLGYEYGTTSVPLRDVTVPGQPQPVPFNQEVTFQTLSLLLALSYVF